MRTTVIKQSIARLLDTEMERKDFLKLVGLGAVAATGVTQIIKAMSQSSPARPISNNVQGYGGAMYGGNPKK